MFHHDDGHPHDETLEGGDHPAGGEEQTQTETDPGPSTITTD